MKYCGNKLSNPVIMLASNCIAGIDDVAGEAFNDFVFVAVPPEVVSDFVDVTGANTMLRVTVIVCVGYPVADAEMVNV